MNKPPTGTGEGIPPEPVLRRVRIPFIRRASLTYRGLSEDVFVVDLGLSGVYVEREPPLPVGESVGIRFAVPGNEIPVSASCRVAWCNPSGDPRVSKALPPGMGLAFVESPPADQARVRRYLLQYLREHPHNRRFHRHWPSGEQGEEP